MPSIADVFVRLRVDRNQLKADILAGASAAGGGKESGGKFGREFAQAAAPNIQRGITGAADKADTSRSGTSHGQKWAENFGKGVSLKGAAISAAVVAALAIGPAGIALAGAAIGVGFAAAAGAAIYKSLSSDLKKAQAQLVKDARAGNVAGAAADKARIASLRAQLASYAKVKAALGGLKATLIDVGNHALVNSGILGSFTKALTTVSRWFTAHQGLFTSFFKAASPYVSVFTGFFLKLVGTLLPMLTRLMNTTRPAVVAVLNAFIGFVKTGLGPFLAIVGKNAGVSAQAFGLMLKNIAPLLPLIATFAGIAAKLILRFPQLAPAILAAAVAIKVFGFAAKAAFISTPWGLAIAAIVAGAVLIATHWKQISPIFQKIAKVVNADFVKPLVNWFTKSLPHAWQVLVSWIQGAIRPFVQLWGAFWGKLGGIIKFYWRIYLDVIKTVWGVISVFLKAGLRILSAVFKAAWGVISAAVKFAWTVIVQIVRVGFALVRAIFNIALNILKGNWTGVWNAIKQFFGVLWSAIKNIVSAALTYIKTILSVTWAAVKSVAVTVWGAIKGVISTVWDGIKRVVGDATGWVASKLHTVWDTIKRAAHAAWGGIKDVVAAAWGGIKAVVAKPINVVIGFIDTVLIGGVDAILSAIGVKGHGPHGGPIPVIPKIPGYASGGKVLAGTHATADDVLVRVSKDETILSAADSAVLAPALSMLRVPGYARGGKISLSGYRNPVRGIRGLTPERIDMGVDFAGSGPIGAIGRARILETGGGGWPGGPYMSYQLLDGPMAGQAIYVAENIRPTVRAGQVVNAGGTIANMFNGGTGIEMGLAAPGGGRPLSQTPAAGSISGANLPANGATQVGQLFDELLVSLGAPRAPNFGRPTGGKIPGNLDKKFPGGGGFLSQLAALAKAGAGALGGLLVTTVTDLLQVAGIPSPVLDAIRSLTGISAPKVGGSGWAHQLPSGAATYTIGKVGGWLRGKAFDLLKAVFAPQIAAAGPGTGTGPAGSGTSAGMIANGTQIFRYLLKNLFGGNKIAAAGATASIWGESLWDPFAQGTGGRGLIGWTPPGTISDADFKGGMRTQLPAILRFVTSSGDSGVIARMFRAASVTEAANEWMTGVERAGKSDVHSQGLSLATQIMNRNAWGGNIREPVLGIGMRSGQGYSFAEQGDERVIPRGGDPMLLALREILRVLDSAPGKTAAGVAAAVKAPRGQEAQAARAGSR